MLSDDERRACGELARSLDLEGLERRATSRPTFWQHAGRLAGPVSGVAVVLAGVGVLFLLTAGAASAVLALAAAGAVLWLLWRGWPWLSVEGDGRRKLGRASRSSEPRR